MTVPMPRCVALLAALTLLGWSFVVSAQQTPKGAAVSPALPVQPVSASAASAEGTLESPRGALTPQRDELRDWRSGGYGHRPPWVKARQDWIEQQSAQLRESMRQRRSELARWRDAMGWSRDPYGQWIQDTADARRAAIDTRRLQAEDRYKRIPAPPWPGQPWGADPWGGGDAPWW